MNRGDIQRIWNWRRRQGSEDNYGKGEVSACKYHQTKEVSHAFNSYPDSHQVRAGE